MLQGFPGISWEIEVRIMGSVTEKQKERREDHSSEYIVKYLFNKSTRFEKLEAQF